MEEVNESIQKLIEFIKQKKELKDYKKLMTALKKYLLDTYRKRYGELKKYSEEHLAGSVFIFEYDKNTYKEWLRYQFVIVINTLDILDGKIIQDFSKNCRYQKDLFNLLDEFLSDVIIFLQENSLFLFDKKIDFGHYKANMEQALFAYLGIQTFLYENLNDAVLDKKFLLHLNIFSLRQAIELRCKEILGIYTITENDNKMSKKFPGGRLIQLIEKNQKKIKLPIKLFIIKNIYEWSNYYVHFGYKPPIWLVIFAAEISKDFFMPDKIEVEETFFKQIESVINMESTVKVLQFEKPIGAIKLYKKEV